MNDLRNSLNSRDLYHVNGKNIKILSKVETFKVPGNLKQIAWSHSFVLLEFSGQTPLSSILFTLLGGYKYLGISENDDLDAGQIMTMGREERGVGGES